MRKYDENKGQRRRGQHVGVKKKMTCGCEEEVEVWWRRWKIEFNYFLL